MTCMGFVVLWVNLQQKLTKATLWRSHWEKLGWMSQWVGQGFRVNSVSQINREHRVGTFMHWAGCGRPLKKGTMTPASAAAHGESCPAPYPSSLPPKVSQFNFSFYVLGSFWATDPELGFEMSESVHGPFKSSASISSSTVSSSDALVTQPWYHSHGLTKMWNMY